MGKFKIFFVMMLSIHFFLYHSDSFAQDRKDSLEKQPSSSSEEGNSCLECHQALKGRLRSVFLEWKESVHAKEGNRCNICHGGNPEIYNARLSKDKKYNFIGRPKKDKITDFCGRAECHNQAYYQFKKSPHYISVQKTGEPNCTSCHGKHNIQRSSTHIITDKTCSDCHSVEYSREIIDMVFSIEDEFDEIESKLNYLIEKRTDIGTIAATFTKSKHLFHQLVHVFSRNDMEFTKKILDLELMVMKEDLEKKVALVKRLNLFYYLTIISIMIILGSLLVYFFRAYFRREKITEQSV